GRKLVGSGGDVDRGACDWIGAVGCVDLAGHDRAAGTAGDLLARARAAAPAPRAARAARCATRAAAAPAAPRTAGRAIGCHGPASAYATCETEQAEPQPHRESSSLSRLSEMVGHSHNERQ